MRIVFFNHKGGVSKTTTTFHLGWKLAERGSRVLLVDADPQCNLTGLIMKDDFERYYTEPATRRNNLMEGVDPAFQGRPEPIRHINCFAIDRNPNLFLLPGHPNLTELEPQLSFTQTTQNAFATMQNLPGAFNALIENTCEVYEIDYVLIDLNPGLSAINQNLFSISDMFIIPTNPDPFSLMAINTLANVLPRWSRSAAQMKDAFQNSSYPFPDRNPKFGGAVMQRFNIRNGRPAAPFRNNMDEILTAIETTLAPSLARASMTYPNTVYEAAGIPHNYGMAEIPDFQSLLPQSHSIGVPVYALLDNEIGRTGTVLAQMVEKRDAFNGMFNDFARIIETVKANA
ncbi:AAA domain-containing protein [Mucilaginibacter gossypiicola]|uniref:AAA domain-containing protein n=1 Tax=Mucilaginibacter gossypiicola TaxID=551995 RepID=A0A1H8EZZ6_9SPHI|nr:ParA family protein [Mucilaginibacter gossypiicola]SEN25063.1 AAA domain-containing protein [Mucilaginibacter gossypiicola]